MKYKLIGWTLGVLFALSALSMLTISIPAGILMIIAAGLLLPPVRDFAYEKTKLAIPIFARVIAVLAIVGYAGHLIQITSFEDNPETVLSEVRAAAQKEDWETVISRSGDYLSTKNPELISLHNKAEIELKKIEAAAAVKKSIEEAVAKIEKECNDTAGAYVASQHFVKKLLKSPATADFPSITSEEVRVNYQGECKHIVYAYVNSQNSFGALLRSSYFAELQKVRSDNSWHLIDIKLYQ